MQKLISLVTFIALFAIAFYAPMASANDDQEDCDQLRATPAVILTSPNSAAGEGTFQVGNRSYHVWYIVNIGDPTPQPNGTQTLLSTHTFNFYSNEKLVGTINTTDTNTLFPTETPGLFRLQTNLTIVSGTKRFKNSCGTLVANAMVDFIQGTAAPMLSGLLCHCENNHDDDND
jgi:hypothetical protein